MRVLIDECLPKALKNCLGGHAVSHVSELGLQGFKDPYLIEVAKGNFDLLITADKRFFLPEHAGFALLIVRTPTNARTFLLGHASRINEAVASARRDATTYVNLFSL